ncbi:MAG: alpha/beta hydrolase [Synechococcus sp. WH 8007]|nr:alpha/beta hydrolase [Synechococcus sp. WH 8007]
MTQNDGGRLINGPETATSTLLLAHGAGAPMDSDWMESVAGGLGACGIRVVRFEFPYMQRSRELGRRCGPDRLPKLLDAYREEVMREQRLDGVANVFIGGKSLGGRVASLLIDALDDVQGCLCLGYPFHPPGKPESLRTDHLESMHSPCLILQGERDSFGRREEVERYSLAPSVELTWLASGDHSFKPTKASALSEADNLNTAIDHCQRFITRHQ